MPHAGVESRTERQPVRSAAAQNRIGALFDTGGLAVLDNCQDVIDSIQKLMRDQENIEDAQKEGRSRSPSATGAPSRPRSTCCPPCGGLVNQYAPLGNDFRVECPVGSGRQMNLLEVSQELA